MPKKKQLLDEVILDAKLVRETALEQARIALEESFKPKIQSMLSKKLQQEQDDEEIEDEELPAEEEEIPAEEEIEDEEIPVEDEEEVTEEEEEIEDELPVEDEIEDEEEVTEEEEIPDEEEIEDEEDLDLEAVIKELEDELEEEEVPPVEDEEVTEQEEEIPIEDEEEDEEIDIEEIIKALKEEDEEEDEEMTEEEDAEEGVEELKTELKEAYDVINKLKNDLNEINMLNAKLLYSNKLFKKHNMTQNQKMKVIETFDRTNSIREIKLVYATLAETLNNTTKTRTNLKESFASDTVRSTKPSKIIKDEDSLATRFRELANLKK
ncbi:MAG: hypothetical protein H8E98_06060 [Bacteroidetes bacterium]|nr:hypothetical protein [Bacteroidota bacterium]